MENSDQKDKSEDFEKFTGRGQGAAVVDHKGREVALASPDESQDSFLATIERLAARPDIDPKKIEQFMNMQERVLDRNAQQAFNHSMTRAQSKIDLVVADIWSVQTKSHYADLKKILVDIKPIYTAEGFSLMYYELETSRENQKKIGVDIMHNQGHTEKRFGYFSIQTTGIAGKAMMTQIHGEGSAIQYGRRYLTCMIFNVPVGKDDDGVAAGSGPAEYIDEKQLSTIVDMINDTEANEPKFLEFLSHATEHTIESVAKIPAKEYNRALKELNRKKRAKVKEERDG